MATMATMALDQLENGGVRNSLTSNCMKMSRFTIALLKPTRDIWGVESMDMVWDSASVTMTIPSKQSIAMDMAYVEPR